MKSVKLKITEAMLDALWGAFSQPVSENFKQIGKNYRLSRNSYNVSLYRLKKSGLVKIISKEGKHFLELTKKGELKILLRKAEFPKPEKWDYKWRLIIFDIPEDAKIQRNRLRQLLKENNFYKLQASVYINPYPLNRQAVSYLRETGLIKFIRILRVDEIDFDLDLRKKFRL